LAESKLFDLRLQKIILKIFDISYGLDQGFSQAIELSADELTNVKFLQEQNLIKSFFGEIKQATQRYCFGIEDTMRGLEMGAVETLIVWDDLDFVRYVVRNKDTGDKKELILNPKQKNFQYFFVDKATNTELEIIEEMMFLEYLTEKYKDFGAKLEIVSDKSSEGSQFVKGFGGIGGLLRYKIEFGELGIEYFEEENDDFDMDHYLN